MKISEFHKQSTRVFVIGDVHGHPKTLKKLVNKFNLEPSNIIIFLGDTINKGPDSYSVIEYIEQLKLRYEVFVIKGNHEYILKAKLKEKKYKNTFIQRELKQSTPQGKVQLQLIQKFFKEIKKYVRIGSFILVHAGLRFHTNKPFKDKIPMLYIRNWYKNINYKFLGNRIIIHGHTPITVKECKKMHAQIKKNQYLNIDTGISMHEEGYNTLTAIELRSLTLYHQKNVDLIPPLPRKA